MVGISVKRVSFLSLIPFDCLSLAVHVKARREERGRSKGSDGIREKGRRAQQTAGIDPSGGGQTSGPLSHTRLRSFHVPFIC